MKLPKPVLGVLAWPISLLYRLWGATLRCEEIGRDTLDSTYARGERLILCIWHGEIFAMFHAKRKLKIAAIISKSRDGELMSQVALRLGCTLVRGSSSKGGLQALRAGVRAIKKDGHMPCITMDGPRGPFHQIKDGVFFLAHYGEASLVPLRAFCRRKKVLNSWDRHCLPLPFSRIRLAFGQPYRPASARLDAESLALEQAELQRRMEGLAVHDFPPEEEHEA
ncbi:MAG: lysophospholipid acyltransferase family protein [Deltaproteobacteria bacterium]|nr:lysophospholipid acyltransferase family protein [Deltaproteobacteria bacterium]